MSPTILARLRQAANDYRTVRSGGIISDRPFMRPLACMILDRSLETMTIEDWED
jgi:hypothetical protein